jgi:CheY-like chemotaxis protein
MPLAAPATTARCPRVLIVDADPALFGLFQEWLWDEGCRVAQATGDAIANAKLAPCDLIVVDLPHPRTRGVDLAARLAQRHLGTPILALSSNFFAGTDCCGPLARRLGVTCVLPTPTSRAALVQALRRCLPA